MAQITESLARSILNGSGYTDNEVKQLAHAWLAAQAAPQQEVSEREAFQKWADELDSLGLNRYWMWQAWQARALKGQPSAPAVPDTDRKDAERYRWLRAPDTDVALVLDKRTGWVPPDEAVPGVGGYHTYEYRAGDELDAAIDAAKNPDERGSEG